MDKSLKASDEELERTVFVNGLCYETTESALRTFFDECGSVE